MTCAHWASSTTQPRKLSLACRREAKAQTSIWVPLSGLVWRKIVLNGTHRLESFQLANTPRAVQRPNVIVTRPMFDPCENQGTSSMRECRTPSFVKLGSIIPSPSLLRSPGNSGLDRKYWILSQNEKPNWALAIAFSNQVVQFGQFGNWGPLAQNRETQNPPKEATGKLETLFGNPH